MNSQLKPLLVKDFLGQILSTIQYPTEDRLAFIEKFILTCHQHTLVFLVDHKSQTNPSISEAFETIKTQDTMTAFLKTHFSQEDYAKAFNDTTLKLIQKYLDSLSPKLTKQQLDQINEYFQHPLITQDTSQSSFV